MSRGCSHAYLTAMCLLQESLCQTRAGTDVWHPQSAPRWTPPRGSLAVSKVIARVALSCGPCVIALPSRAPGFGGLHHETYCGCRTTAPALAWHELSCENHIVQHMYANERLTERHSKCGTRNLHKTYSIELLVLMARTNVRSYLFVRFG